MHLGLRALEVAGAPAELLHAVAAHHDVRASRTAEAAALYHANQLDAVAAGRDPAGVSFDPATPPVVFEAGNYILDRGDSKAAELMSG